MHRDLDPEQRPEVILLAAQGLHNEEIAARLHCPREFITEWRLRFYEQCLCGLDQPCAMSPPRGAH
jgi:DNA-directed RNA polymerase specialized sigma24 family protein